MSEQPELNIPELRMINSPPNQTWQWKFSSDGQWREMMGTVDSEMKRDKSKEVTKLPSWIPWAGGTVLKKGPLIDVSGGGFGGKQNLLNKALETLFPEMGDEYIQSVVDFDILAGKTNLLPDDFLKQTSPSYVLAVAELWKEVTGYTAAKGYQVARYDNQKTYKGDVDGESELIKIAGDLAEDMDWRGVAEARGYDIDWGDEQSITDFLFFDHDDFVRGIKYDDQESASTGKGVVSHTFLGEEHYDSVSGEPVLKNGASGTDRKVVAEFGEGKGNGNIAKATAAKIPNAKAEEIDGQWVITVPPGQGGFTSIDAGNSFIRDAGLDATKWEMAPNNEGQLLIREIRPEAATQGSKTVAEARTALEATGADPDQYEFRAGDDGKIYPVYTGKPEEPPAYSTPTTYQKDDAGNLVLDDAGNPIVIAGTPGEMFEPTITEDPTGRKFGTTAGGDIKDFGYGMAGDITQEELAGYQPPERSLDMIVAKAIEQGNWELARGVQAFKDRPTETELLKYAAQYAESPADLAVLSSIARGQTMVQPGVALPEGMGTGQGQATRIGAPGAEYVSAYKQFKDAMDLGFDPTLPENQQALNDLFKPENDPVYQATQELANKYETEIGTLRDQIAEANKTSSERIENNQTQTMNMMTGMFESSLSSFKELMKTTTDMKDSEIEGLHSQLESMRMGTDDTDSSSSSASGSTAATNTTVKYWGVAENDWVSKTGTHEYHQSLLNSKAYTATNPAGDKPGVTESDTGKWFWDTSGDGKWIQYNGEGKFDTMGGRYLLEPEGQDFHSTGQPHPDHVGAGDSEPISLTTGDDELTDTGIPTDISSAYGDYQTVMGAGEAASPALQEQFADIVTNVPGETATESQFAYQTGGKDWESGDDSWQSSYFGDQAKTEQESLAIRPDQWEFEGAEGGVVQGPTMALLGEKEPEFIVPFSKVDEFRRGKLPIGNPRQTRRGSTVANFTDSMPRFANGGMVTGPERNYRFGGVTAADLTPYGETGAYVTSGTRKELDLGAEGQYGADGISRAPRIGSSDFESLVKQYTKAPSQQEEFFQEFEGTTPRVANLANIPEYELRQRLGASEFAGTDPTQHPIGIQQLMAGRPMARPRSLMTAANMPKPSGQALRNMLPSETAYYQKMGRMAGIPQEELEREMRSVMPGGNRRTPLRMGARRMRQT